MGKLSIEELLNGRISRKMSAARSKESNTRLTTASNMARAALVALHRGDYEELYRQAKAKIDAERGPLPD